MTIEQISAVYSLPNHPEIDFVTVSNHKNIEDISVSSAVDADVEKVKSLVAEAIGFMPNFEPGHHSKNNDIVTYLYADFFSHPAVYLHINKKAPAEAEENTHLDSSTLAEMSASVEREA